MSILFYILFLGLFFLANFRKYGLNAGSFLIGIYLISAVAGSIALFGYDNFDIDRIKFSAVLYHCICLFLFIYPIVWFSNKYNRNLRMPDSTGIKIFTYFLITLGFLSIIAILPKLSTVFSADDLRVARNMYNYGMLHEERDGGILAYIGSIGGTMAYFALFMFFYYLCYYPKKKLIIALLFIASFADLLTSLSIVGRGGVVRWLFMFSFMFFFFRDQLDRILMRKMIRYVLIFSLPFIIVFGLITVSRFDNREYSIVFSILSYLGQGFIYFSYNFDQFFDSTFHGRLNFPILFPGESVSRRLSEAIYTDYNLNTFSTFVGSFYKDVGFYTTLLIAVIYRIWALFSFQVSKNANTLSKIVLFIVITQVVLNGLFYFTYTSTTSVRSYIALYVFALIIQIRFSRKIQ